MPDVTAKSARADSSKTYRVHKTVELRRSPQTETDINKRSSLSSRRLLVQRHMPAVTDHTQIDSTDMVSNPSQPQLTSTGGTAETSCQQILTRTLSTVPVARPSGRRCAADIKSSTGQQTTQATHQPGPTYQLQSMSGEDLNIAVPSSVNFPINTAGSSTSTTTTFTAAGTSSKPSKTHVLSPYAQIFSPAGTSRTSTEVTNPITHTSENQVASAAPDVTQQGESVNQSLTRMDRQCTPTRQQLDGRGSTSEGTDADAKINSENIASPGEIPKQPVAVDKAAQPMTSSQRDRNERQTLEGIKSINGKRVIQKQAWYKVYFNDSKQPQWMKAQDLPTQLLIDYNAKKYKQKQKAAARRRRAYDQY
jgi:hypothetical protein